eukprot:7265314-Alexandrium_andersonii.AAC.1
MPEPGWGGIGKGPECLIYEAGRGKPMTAWQALRGATGLAETSQNARARGCSWQGPRVLGV